MKRLLTAIMLIALLTISSATLAYEEVQVFMLGETGWGAPTGDLGLYAKAFTSNPVVGQCNREKWVNTITNHATIAQWINYSFGGTRWDWQVRKPGTFAADCIQFAIQSNDDVNVAFDGFADLEPLSHPGANPIPVWYGYGNIGGVETPPSEWLTATELNDADFQLAYEDIAGGLSKKLWNKIEVDETTRACDYENSGTITLTLTDMKYFINPVSGDFNGALPVGSLSN